MKNLSRLIVAACLFISTGSLAQNTNVTFRANMTTPWNGQSLANIWGYVDSTGREYALVGASAGMSIVDVTNPSAPVHIKQIAGPNNGWREIKTYKKYAYVTTEGGGGLQIINLSNLPGTNTPSKFWAPNISGNTLGSIHALHIDEAKGYVYLYGSNLFNGGAVVADIKTDPWNPVYVGKWNNGTGNQQYIHDGTVRNDTMYGGHIYAGYFDVVDFTNKANPVLLGQRSTPHNFTHNTWLSNNSKTIFTTDEVNGSFLTSYDISNLGNITELDRIQSNPGSGSVVHNTYIHTVNNNQYAVTSWYKDGFIITDVARPNNMVQVGNYDTYTAGAGGGFAGAWGVYPYLPSGTIVVSNIGEGLWVFSPTYVRACYLEGIVTDSITTLPLNTCTVRILTTSVTDYSNITGQYRTGYHVPGTYSIQFSKSGYYTKTITGVNLSAGVVTNLNVALRPMTSFAVTGKVIENQGGAGIANANVRIYSSTYNYTATTNATGDFNVPGVYNDTYTIVAGKWGYRTNCNLVQNLTSTSGTITVPLDSAIYDDFTFNNNWTVSSTASSGIWVRGVPIGTDFNTTGDCNPGVDVSSDCTDMAFVTGNGGGSASTDDIDNGHTILTSPVFNLTKYNDPYLNYHRWFMNAGGSGTPNDSLIVRLSNGSTTVTVETVLYNTTGNSTWRNRNFKISSLITPTANMRLILRTADANAGHLVEAGLDKFEISNGGGAGIFDHNALSPEVKVYPNPFNGSFTVDYQLMNKLDPGAQLIITDIAGRVVDTKAINAQAGVLNYQASYADGIYFLSIRNGSEVTRPAKVVRMQAE